MCQFTFKVYACNHRMVVWRRVLVISKRWPMQNFQLAASWVWIAQSANGSGSKKYTNSSTTRYIYSTYEYCEQFSSKNATNTRIHLLSCQARSEKPKHQHHYSKTCHKNPENHENDLYGKQPVSKTNTNLAVTKMLNICHMSDRKSSDETWNTERMY